MMAGSSRSPFRAWAVSVTAELICCRLWEFSTTLLISIAEKAMAPIVQTVGRRASSSPLIHEAI